MLRKSHQHWWQRLFIETMVPAYVLIRPDADRHCPECSAAYDARDHYCPRCHVAVPEWRFG
jgi:uncharacterized paraquat-inducible protein A